MARGSRDAHDVKKSLDRLAAIATASEHESRCAPADLIASSMRAAGRSSCRAAQDVGYPAASPVHMFMGLFQDHMMLRLSPENLPSHGKEV